MEATQPVVEILLLVAEILMVAVTLLAMAVILQAAMVVILLAILMVAVTIGERGIQRIKAKVKTTRSSWVDSRMRDRS